MKISKELGSQLEVANSLSHLADLYTELKKYDKAQKCYEQGLQIAQEIKALDLQAVIYAKISDFYAVMGDYKKAFQWYDKAFNKTFSLHLWLLIVFL